MHVNCQFQALISLLGNETDSLTVCQMSGDATPLAKQGELLHFIRIDNLVQITRILDEHPGLLNSIVGWTYGESLLHHASARASLDVVKHLIDRGADTGAKTLRTGMTALHYACADGRLEVVQHLVQECGLDPNCRDKDGVTPFHYACSMKPPSLPSGCSGSEALTRR